MTKANELTTRLDEAKEIQTLTEACKTLAEFQTALAARIADQQAASNAEKQFGMEL